MGFKRPVLDFNALILIHSAARLQDPTPDGSTTAGTVPYFVLTGPKKKNTVLVSTDQTELGSETDPLWCRILQIISV